MQQRFIPAFEQALETHQRPFRVGGGGERGLEVRLDGGEGFAEEGGDGVQRVHEVIIPFARRQIADLTCLIRTAVSQSTCVDAGHS